LLDEFMEDRGYAAVLTTLAGGMPVGPPCQHQLSELLAINEQLLERARNDGTVRADLEVTDMPPLYCALASVVQAGVADWRRYLELMTKVDQLMPMLETLAIDEVIEVAQLDLQKGLAKKSVRQVAGAVRNFLAGLRKRMNAIAEEDATQAASGQGQEGEAGAGSPNALAGVSTKDSQATSPSAGLATDAPADDGATTKPPRTKQKGKALTSTESASPLSAPA
jgi:hypothetical protein